MEQKETHDGGPPAGARSGVAGSFTHRRQKNLQKFRKHKEAQRHQSAGSLETKPMKEAAPIETKPTTETKPIVSVKKTNNREIETKNDSNRKPQSPPFDDKKERVRRAEEGQAGAMSPQCTSKRRADIIKKLTKKNRFPNESPKKGRQESSTATVISTSDVVEEMPPLPFLSMGDSSDPSAANTVTSEQGEKKPCGTNKTNDKKLANAKDELESKLEAAPDKDEIENRGQANENAQSEVQDKVTSMSSEEALKPKTNNRLRGRRPFHHKKKIKDKNREEKALSTRPESRTTPVEGPKDAIKNEVSSDAKQVSAMEVCQQQQDEQSPPSNNESSQTVDAVSKEEEVDKDSECSEFPEVQREVAANSNQNRQKIDFNSNMAADSTGTSTVEDPARSFEPAPCQGDHKEKEVVAKVSQNSTSESLNPTPSPTTKSEGSSTDAPPERGANVGDMTATQESEPSTPLKTLDAMSSPPRKSERCIAGATPTEAEEKSCEDATAQPDTEATTLQAELESTPRSPTKSERPAAGDLPSGTGDTVVGGVLTPQSKSTDSTPTEAEEKSFEYVTVQPESPREAEKKTLEDVTAQPETGKVASSNTIHTTPIPALPNGTGEKAREVNAPVQKTGEAKRSETVEPTLSAPRKCEGFAVGSPTSKTEMTTGENFAAVPETDNATSPAGAQVKGFVNNSSEGGTDTHCADPKVDNGALDKKDSREEDKWDDKTLMKVYAEVKDKAHVSTDQETATPEFGLGDKSNSFDLRSIHDFPPKHIKDADALLPTQDPSWDTAKVFFTEYQPPSFSQAKSDPMSLFDTPDTSWSANNATTFASAFESPNNGFASGSSFSEVFEEKKELDDPALQLHLEPTAQPPLMEPKGSPASIVSPRRRLSRVQVNEAEKAFGFDVSNLAMDSTDELDDRDGSECAKDIINSSEEHEDENLLGEKVGTGRGSDNDSGGNKADVSKEERLKTYTTTCDGDDNSSESSSSEDADDDSSRASEEPPAVEYVSQPEADTEDDAPNVIDDGLASLTTVEDTPQLALSAVAASSADGFGASGGIIDGISGLEDTSKLASAPAESCINSLSALQSDDTARPEADPALGGNQDSAVGYISNSSSSGASSVDGQDDGHKAANHQGDGEVNKQVLACGSSGSNESTEGSSDAGNEQEKTCSESTELEESASLVGVELVPSFGATSGKTGCSGQSKTRVGIPPRGSLSPSTLPPPPPPPLSKKKRRKNKNKTKGSSKAVPLLAPPPIEKLKKWQDSKGRANKHLAVVKEAEAEDSGVVDQDQHQDKSTSTGLCGAFPEASESWDIHPESPGRIKLACGNFSNGSPWGSSSSDQRNIKCGETDMISDAFALAGLKVAPQKAQARPSPSPMEAARSIALENAMKRATQGLPKFDFVSNTRGQVDIKSLLETEIVSSASVEEDQPYTEWSLGETESKKSDKANKPSGKTLGRMERKVLAGKPIVFLDQLTSPSLSMSPSTKHGESFNASKPTGASSPLIHDSKMAEKAALASYAAAVTFEEQYAYTLSKDSGTEKVEMSGRDEREKDQDPESSLPSLFCAPELEEKFQRMATRDDEGKSLQTLFFASEMASKHGKEFAEMIDEHSGILKGLVTGSPPRDTKNEVQGLRGGAFSPWRNAMYAKGATGKSSVDDNSVVPNTLSAVSSSSTVKQKTRPDKGSNSLCKELVKVYKWLTTICLSELESQPVLRNISNDGLRNEITRLLEDDENLNKLCIFVVEKVNVKIELENEERARRNGQLSPRKKMRPFLHAGRLSGQKSSSVVAANFVSFIHRISKASGVPSPFGEDNPFLLDLVGTSMSGVNSPMSAFDINDDATMQNIVFNRCAADKVAKFCIEVCGGLAEVESSAVGTEVDMKTSADSSVDMIEASRAANPSPTKKSKDDPFCDTLSEAESNPSGDRALTVPNGHPSPFESAIEQDPKILKAILGFLGDPVAVCRLKMTNRNCSDYVNKNEQVLMRDAVRLGGLSMNLRPSFWLWVILEKCGREAEECKHRKRLLGLEEEGRTGKWHNVIQRDVARSFGNMPPHKTGARLRTDSIVRALVTWGRNRIMKRGVKGDGMEPYSCSHPSFGDSSASDASQAPTDTVSDWGGVSPVASFTGSCSGIAAAEGDDQVPSIQGSQRRQDSPSVSTELLVLSGNALSDEMKSDLQSKLGFILHALAAAHEDVGYCQGMDYVVAHLLRILQDTVCWRAASDTLPASIHVETKEEASVNGSDTDSVSQGVEDRNKIVVVDTVFQVMDCLFTTYNLQHMYWPELRCLKTCCKVFERLIQLKLPVLADHFEHHELNVGLFALGWFQTLFLYLPSMPSATVCHMWDIWLVERSFKIFFRVGTAILFLSQPILLNHETEGMMTYLNTFPDATLLNPDILIACALQIKVTNKMLMDIEEEVCGKD